MPGPSPVAPTGPVRVPDKPAIAPKPHQGGKGRSWLGITIALLVVIGAYAAYRLWLKPSGPAQSSAAVVTSKAFVGPLDVTLRLSGQTSARNFANVTAPMI